MKQNIKLLLIVSILFILALASILLIINYYESRDSVIVYIDKEGYKGNDYGVYYDLDNPDILLVKKYNETKFLKAREG